MRMASALDILARRGTCVIVITHDLELMKLSCTRALRLPLPIGKSDDTEEHTDTEI